MSEDLQEHLPTGKKLGYSYFFENFELSVQVIFDEICIIKNLPLISINTFLKRGNYHLKADYFVPLKNFEVFQFDCEEIVKKLKEIEVLSLIEIDSKFNLTFRFHRPEVYRTVLDEVVKYGIDYGMNAIDKSILVLIDNDETSDFIQIRNNQVAKHIISILCANKVKVFYYGSTFEPKLEFDNAVSLMCSESYCVSDISDQLKEKLSVSEWKKESKVASDLCIDAKVYLETNSVTDKYGKDLNNIVISNDVKCDVLAKAANVKHILNDHIVDRPDLIIHVASHTINRDVWKAGILLQMLEDSNYAQTYIFNQNVKINDNPDLSYSDYVTFHKHEIEKAMAQKYDIDVCRDKTWSTRIQNLVDSVVKFDFLKLNPNMALKIDLSSCHSTEKNAGIFVQYNFARLSNLFMKFESKVAEGFYDPLETLQDVDFTLLRLEEEWNLFQYVIQFPKLVERILDSLLSNSTLKTRFPINNICVMLSELCHYLSLYYSKVRILAGPQRHLQKVMNARLWLLKGIYQVILNSFVLLNIQGLDQM